MLFSGKQSFIDSYVIKYGVLWIMTSKSIMWTDCSTTVVLEILEVSKNGITKREIIDKCCIMMSYKASITQLTEVLFLSRTFKVKIMDPKPP